MIKKLNEQFELLEKLDKYEHPASDLGPKYGSTLEKCAELDIKPHMFAYENKVVMSIYLKYVGLDITFNRDTYTYYKFVPGNKLVKPNEPLGQDDMIAVCEEMAKLEQIVKAL